MISKKNYKGESLDGVKLELVDESFGTGTVNSYGNPVVKWPEPSDLIDKDGFDKTVVDSGGNYRIKMTLEKGTILIRYGSEFGNFTAPKGAAYEELSLPYKKETVEYNEYEVVADSISVFCVVDKGIVAPCFNQKGGAVQYLHSLSMYESVKQNILKRLGEC